MERRDRFHGSLNMSDIKKLISEYLIHCFLYYELGESVISDDEYNLIPLELVDRFEEVLSCDHIHKKLVKLDAIKGSTGFHLKGKYPQVVKFCAYEMLDEYKQSIEDLKDIKFKE